MTGNLTQRHTDLIAWAKSCLETHDWHGLRDAAADLEVCEARMEEQSIRATVSCDPIAVCEHGVLHDGCFRCTQCDPD